MRRLLGYSCNLYNALESQLKTLNALEIYTTLVIEFVLHHRFSAILVMLIILNFNVFNWSSKPIYSLQL